MNRKPRLPSLAHRAGFLAAALFAGCTSTSDPVERRPQQVENDPGGTQTTTPTDSTEWATAPMVTAFQPTAPASYVAKVKDLLVGQPPTDDEVRSVTLDPQALRGLIDLWMGTPEYRAKML